MGLLDHEVYDHVVPVRRIASHNAPIEHLDRITHLLSRIPYQSLVFIEINFRRYTVVMDGAPGFAALIAGRRKREAL